MAGSETMRRRAVLGLGLAALVGGGIFAARWYMAGAVLSAEGLSVEEAHRQALAGEIVLVDIRRPDEWARTGLGEGAVPLDMRRVDFAEALTALAGARPVALICATGGRSAWMAARLRAAGVLAVQDVPEGMLGSGAGPGWLRAGLPVVRP